MENRENIANIAVFMNKLCISYAKYFNKKYNRTGALFEGPFRSTHVENDGQAKYLFSYIHLNPMKIFNPNWKKEKLRDNTKNLELLKKYKYSSHKDYLKEDRLENKILDIKEFPLYLIEDKDYKKELKNWLIKEA